MEYLEEDRIFLREKYEEWREKNTQNEQKRRRLERQGIYLSEPGRVKHASTTRNSKKQKSKLNANRSPNTRLSTPREQEELNLDYVQAHQRRGSGGPSARPPEGLEGSGGQRTRG